MPMENVTLKPVAPAASATLVRPAGIGEAPLYFRRAARPDVAGQPRPRPAAQRTALRNRPQHSQPRLVLYVLGVALLLAASIGAIADQSERFTDVHELPPFVCSRVDLLQHADASAGWSGFHDAVPDSRASACRVAPSE